MEYINYARMLKVNKYVGIFFAASIGDLFTYCITSVQLALAYPSENGGVMLSAAKFLAVFAPTQVPLAIIEGILTVVIIIGLETYAKAELTGLGLPEGRRKLMTKTKKTVVSLLIVAALIAIIPLFTLKGAEFGGSDDAGSKVVSEITGTEYKPWFKPVMETWIGGELPSEVESLLFWYRQGLELE